MLHSSPYRCAETAVADYLELGLGALQDTMSHTRINRYGDEHLSYWAAVLQMQALAGKLPGRRQTGDSGFAMTKRSTCHSHICLAFLFPIAVSCTVLFGLCTYFGPISSLCVSSFMASFFCMLSLVYPSFTSFPLSSSSAFPSPALLAFPFPQSHTLFLFSPLTVPLLQRSFHLYVVLGTMQGPTGRM